MEENRNNIQDTYMQEDSSINLVELWTMVWNAKWWYAAALVLALCFAAFQIYRTPAVYSRVAKVIVDENTQDAAMRDFSALTGGIVGGSTSINANNETEAFASPDLMQKVVERLSLETSYFDHQFMRTVEMFRTSPVELSVVETVVSSPFSFTVTKTGDRTFNLTDIRIGGDKEKYDDVKGSLGDTLDVPFGKIVLLPTLYESNWENDITVSRTNSMTRAKAFCSNLVVSVPGKQVTVISINLKDKFPNRADQILSTLIDVYNESWIFDKNKAARNTSDFINDRLVIVEKDLAAVEGRLQQYKEKNNLTNIRDISNSYLHQSTEYSAKLFEVNNQLAIAGYIRDYLRDPANALSLIPSNSGLTSGNVEGQIGEYNKLLLTRNKLMSTSSERNPIVSDMNVALDAIRVSILSSIDNLISTLELQSDKIKSQEDLILKRIASSTGQEMHLLSIERQRAVTENLYVFLLQRREENEISSMVNVGNTRLIVSPNGSPNPTDPNKMMILMMAIVLGLGLPFGVQFLLRMLDDTVRNRGDLMNVDIPFIAEIPQLPSSRKFGFLPDRLYRYNDANREIWVQEGSRDFINESFRILRTNLDFMIGNGENKVIMLTSFNVSSGKTFVTANIAASMALKNKKVIVVDLDLRKGSLGKFLLKGVNAGYSAYLSGIRDEFKSAIYEKSENLHFLPVGALPPNPVELLLTDRFGKMMKELRQQYDYIFLDCPPMDIVADTSIIANSADMTIFVVRAGLMLRKAVPMLQKIYREGNYPRMSIVLNGVESKEWRYGYGRYGYGYGYGYGNVYGSDGRR